MSVNFADLPLDQRIDVLGSEYYGMVFLGMANAAYTDAGGTWKQAIADDLAATIANTNYIPALPELGQEGQQEPANTVPGAWSLDWGPAFPTTFEANRSNLIYIASYRDESGKPYFFVVGIRGTDISAGGLSVLKQVFEDFDAFATVEWSTFFSAEAGKLDPSVKTGPTPAGYVAQGSFDGARDLVDCLPTPPEGQAQPAGTLQQALLSLLGQENVDADTPIVVTGHSLGGCQTQTIASYVQWLCPANAVIPHAFAPSTAGDVEFIAGEVFSRGAFWFNTLDLVPWGFVTIPKNVLADAIPDAIPDPAQMPADDVELGAQWAETNLWATYSGPSLPALDVIDLLIKVKGERLIENRYARPNPGLYPDILKKMDGTMPDEDTLVAFYEALKHKDPKDPDKLLSNSLLQLEWQHFPPNYQQLLWANYQGSMVYYDYKSIS